MVYMSHLRTDIYLKTFVAVISERYSSLPRGGALFAIVSRTLGIADDLHMRCPQDRRSSGKDFSLAICIFRNSLARTCMHEDILGVTLLVVAVSPVMPAQALDRNAMDRYAVEDLPKERA